MKALFPGSFDPFTIGHADILQRILPLFDSVVVGIGVNEGKRALATPLERKRTIEQIFKDEPKVSVETYSDLTADFAQRIGADYIVRGLRSARDYDYERELAAVNRKARRARTPLRNGPSRTCRHLIQRRPRTHRLRTRRLTISSVEKNFALDEKIFYFCTPHTCDL